MLLKLVIFMMMMPNLAHGAPPRPHGAEDTEEAVKVKNSVAKAIAASIIWESDGSARADIANTNVKQQTLGGNGEENLIMGTTISARGRMTNGVSAIKGDGVHETDQNGHKSEGGSLHSTAPATDEIPSTAMQVGHIEKLDDSNVVIVVLTESSSGRLALYHVSGTGALHSRHGKMFGERGPEPSIKDRAGPLERGKEMP